MRALCDDMTSMNTFKRDSFKNIEFLKRRTFINIESVDVVSEPGNKLLRQNSELGSIMSLSAQNRSKSSSVCKSQAAIDIEVEVLSVSEEEMPINLTPYG
jgi:hypothetical protein